LHDAQAYQIGLRIATRWVNERVHMLTLGSTADVQPAASNTASVHRWLFAVAGLVFLMVSVGGATRLTGSGLSITEWQPIMGTLPPLSEAAWLEAFNKYRQIPQYQLVNKGMSLAAFKSIFWWEWGHRFLGRVIGLAYLLPFLYFLARGAVRGPLVARLWGLFVLGGLQGALGWFMVQSGLSQRTDVSQYRLAAHLLMASLLLAALLWTALDLASGASRRPKARPGYAATAGLILALVFVQIGAGALVAGMKAGLAYNTWPLMDGRIIPGGLGAMTPVWLNVFENAATVQFDHRVLAYILAALVVWHGTRVIRHADDLQQSASAKLLLATLALQILIGIWTLLAHVPLPLGLAHQATAMLVLAAATWHLHTLTHASAATSAQ
jgi:heme a synthase